MWAFAGVFICIALTTLAGQCQGHCPDAWTYFKGSCYLFGHDYKTFTEAEHYCRQHNAHLARVETSQENNFLKSVSTQLKETGMWIGLTDTDIENVWKYTDGTTASYFDWARGEPNQHTSANCAALWKDHLYAWTDEPCSHTFKPICEVSCQCNNCHNMPSRVESKCCRTTNIVDGKMEAEGLACIIDHDGFQSNCLNIHVLEVAYYDHVIQTGPLEEEQRIHELYRHLAYRRFTRWVYGLLGKGVRKVIPSCAVTAIRNRFPSEDYCGFRYPQ